MMRRRERQGVREHFPPKERRRAGDRVWRGPARRGWRGCSAERTSTRARRPLRQGAPPWRRCRRARPRRLRRPTAPARRVPAVVLVAERDQLRVGSERQGSLEVPVEAEMRAPRQCKAPVPRELSLEFLRPVGTRPVVADHADPVAVRLLPERVELVPQQLQRWIEGRHADGDPRARRAAGNRGAGPPVRTAMV